MIYALYSAAACALGCTLGYVLYRIWMQYNRRRVIRRQLNEFLAKVTKASTVEELQVIKIDLVAWALQSVKHLESVHAADVMQYIEEKSNKLEKAL